MHSEWFSPAPLLKRQRKENLSQKACPHYLLSKVFLSSVDLIILDKSKGLSTFTPLTGLLPRVSPCVCSEEIAVAKTFPAFFTFRGLLCSLGHTVLEKQSG